MRLNIYRRTDGNGNSSYLAVPEGKLIPEEAVNTDWQVAAQAVELDEEKNELSEYLIEQPVEQINDKGYAIARLNDVVHSST
jgi:hypothetical protein